LLQSSPGTPLSNTNFSHHRKRRNIWRPSPDGCQETFEYGNRALHETTCGHTLVVCFNEGCPTRVKRKDLESHMASCPYRVIRCLLCKETVLYFAQEKHGLHCPEKTLYCPLNCGNTYVRREQVLHTASCPAAIAPCLHSQYGCTYEGRRDTINNHLEGCPYEGIKGYISTTQQQIQHLLQLTRSQHQELRVLQTALATQGMELAMIKRLLPVQQTQNINGSGNDSGGANNNSDNSSYLRNSGRSFGSTLRARLGSLTRGSSGELERPAGGSVRNPFDDLSLE